MLRRFRSVEGSIGEEGGNIAKNEDLHLEKYKIYDFGVLSGLASFETSSLRSNILDLANDWSLIVLQDSPLSRMLKWAIEFWAGPNDRARFGNF